MPGQRQTRVGRVLSDKMDKTVVVGVETRMPHPLYRRVIKRLKKYKAHNEGNLARLGDLVRIVETRPLSKEKRWAVVEILSRGKVAEVPPEEIAEPTAREEARTGEQSS